MRIIRAVALGAFLAGSSSGIARTARAQPAESTGRVAVSLSSDPFWQTRIAPLLEEARTGFRSIREPHAQREKTCLDKTKESTKKCTRDSIKRTGFSLDSYEKCVRPAVKKCEDEAEAFVQGEVRKRSDVFRAAKQRYGEFYENIDEPDSDRLIDLESDLDQLPISISLRALSDRGTPHSVFTEEMNAYASQLEREKSNRRSGPGSAHLPDERSIGQRILDMAGSVVSTVFVTISAILLYGTLLGIGIAAGWQLNNMHRDGSLDEISHEEMRSRRKQWWKWFRIAARVTLEIARRLVSEAQARFEKF